MSSLQPLKPDDPMLRKPPEPVTKQELRTNAIQDDIERLLDYVYGENNKGVNSNRQKPMTVGLSANQVGIGKRISIVDIAIGKKRYNEVLILINPEITWRSKSVMEFDEACINLPEVWGLTRSRAKRVKATALTRSGKNIELDVSGAAAVLLQHEVDHLDGRLFIDHMEDPSRACLVKNTELPEYKKSRRNKETWTRTTDASHLARQ